MNDNKNDTKRCNDCRKVKLIECFHVIKDKLSKTCIICERNRNQKYREENRNNNQLDIIKCCKICHKDKPLQNIFRSASGWYRKYCKDCYENLPQEIKDKDLKTKEIRRINERNRHRLNARKSMLKAAKGRSKRDNLDFNIEECDIIIPEYCPILGIKIEKGIGNSTDNSPTLDKIIPKLGYIKGNICVISWRANSLKKDGRLDEFERIVKYLKDRL